MERLTYITLRASAPAPSVASAAEEAGFFVERVIAEAGPDPAGLTGLAATMRRPRVEYFGPGPEEARCGTVTAARPAPERLFVIRSCLGEESLASLLRDPRREASTHVRLLHLLRRGHDPLQDRG